MDEHVFAGLALDESKAFAGIKPLYCSLFFQLCISFLFELFVSFHVPQGKKRGTAGVDLQPLQKSKGFYKNNKRRPILSHLYDPVYVYFKLRDVNGVLSALYLAFIAFLILK